MKKKLFIFGATSEIAKNFITKVYRKYDLVCFSSKKKNFDTKVKFFKIDYNSNEIKDIIKFEMINKLKNVFLFFNGLSDDKAFYKTSVKSIKKIININFLLPVIFTNFIIKNYYLSGSTFIYFASSRALRSDLGISLYSSSKTALPAFAKSMALEYGAVGMNFKIISLGLFNGGMENNLSESKKKSILDRSAIKEKVKISQLVSTIEFAIKDHAGNGSIIKCDNGYL